MSDDAQIPKTESEKENNPLEKLSITMDKRIDLAVSLGVALLGAFIVIEARDIRLGMVPDPITSRGMVNITGIFLIILGLFLAIARLVNWSALPGNLIPAEGQPDEEGHPASSLRYFGIALAGLLWVWLIKSLGFLIVMPLVLFAILLLMNVRSRMKLVAFPVIFTLLTWYMFSQLLSIIIPLGPFTSFARSLGLTP
jgi:hypothetical protein